MSEQDEPVVDTITSTEEEPDIILDDVEDTEDIEVLKDNLEKAQDAQRLIHLRAKKAEAQVRDLESQLKTSAHQPINKQPTDESIQAMILKSQGMSDELLGELKVIAKARGKSVLDTVNDPIFVAIKNQKEQEEKTKRASLPASKGAGQAIVKKGFQSENLTAEEHKAMWKETQLG